MRASVRVPMVLDVSDEQESRAWGEERVLQKWHEIGPLIDVLAQRANTPGEWRAAPGSSLAGDDRASAPYQVSHAVHLCLLAAIDHAHAVKRLVFDHQELHTSAPGSLSRGFIENAATAYWILHPSGRAERVARTLKWHVKNANDRNTALSNVPEIPPPRRPVGKQIQSMLDVATSARIEDHEYVRRGYRPSQPVEYADMHAGVLGVGVLFSWQICSGFAHGRPWASMGVLQREELPTADPGVVDMRLSNDFTRTLFPVLTGMHLMEVVLKLHRSRSTATFT